MIYERGVSMTGSVAAPLDVAKWFLSKAGESNRGLTPMQLQKLMYYAHGFNLARSGDPLLSDGIQAWEHGPVNPSIYRCFKDYSNTPINNINVDRDQLEQALPDRLKQVLADVWECHGHKSATELWRSTHSETPWKNAYIDGVRNIVISDEAIAAFFKSVPEALSSEASDRDLRHARAMSDLRRRRAMMGDRPRLMDKSEMNAELDEWSNIRKAASSRILE
ncbi:SocA family protein [Rhodococcus fascians]|nr:SocA family protein [Rhodococcus fascians]MBY3999571.1 SocA family protein [Rhodococcus fascians]MBY4001217.1 SocA family protein [Rhodococcus fascians]MBY4009528.1 SocA family protein [Rhodococcus fascians]MBY4015361.1 SocA family protein [Rhodococcus fascians]